MHTLVKLKGTKAVWVSDVITRRWVQDPTELSAVQAALKARGLPTTVREVTSLSAWGVPVGPTPPT